MRYTFPTDYDIASCYLVPINASLIPLVAGALARYYQEHTWASPEDYEKGYNAIAELEACMSKLCVNALLEKHDQLYRLIDTTMNGRLYVASGSGTIEDPLIVNPAIPAAPLPADSAVYPGLVMRIDRLEQMLNNFANGTPSAEFTDVRNIRQQIADLIMALSQQGQLDDEMLAELMKIVVALA